MNKTLKRISALVLAAASCLVLCSCNIKEMKEAWAFYSENEGEIIWGGQVYKSLDRQYLPEGFEMRTEGVCYITEKDVPVLLSTVFGDGAVYNHNKTMVRGSGVKSSCYAREDVFDYVNTLFENHHYIDRYCVEVHNEFTSKISFELVEERYISAIYGIVSNDDLVIEEQSGERTINDYTHIYLCDPEMIFQSLSYNIFEEKNGDIKIRKYYDTYHTYLVPDDKKAMMKELLTLGEGGLR